MRNSLRNVTDARRVFFRDPGLFTLHVYLHCAYKAIDLIAEQLKATRKNLLAEANGPVVAPSARAIAEASINLMTLYHQATPILIPTLFDICLQVDLALSYLCNAVSDEVSRHQKDWTGELGWLTARLAWRNAAPQLEAENRRLKKESAHFISLIEAAKILSNHAIQADLERLLLNHLPETIEQFDKIGGSDGLKERQVQMGNRVKFIRRSALILGGLIILYGYLSYGL